MTIADQVDRAAALPPPPAPVRVQFVGRVGDYWRLTVRGAILQAITLGFYRFWLFTDMRRLLWAATRIAGATPEYAGTGSELLIGYLMAVVILIPVYALFLLAAMGAGLMNETWVSASFAFMALGTFSGYAAYRARRYRLTRTVFRGLRCHQTGSAILYAVRVMLWWILVGMTLGLAWPWAMASLERYKMRNTFYGDLRGSFAGSGTSLFASGILIWLLIMGPLVGLAVAGGMLIDWSALIDALDDPDQFGSTINALKDDHNARLGFRLLLRGGFWAVLMGTVIYPAYQAIVMRWWLGGLRLGGAAVASDLRIGRFYKAYLLYLAYVMLFSIAFFAAVGLAFGLGYMALSDRYESDAQAEGLVYATLTLAYLVYLLGIHTIYQVVIKLDLWRAAAESMLILGCAAFDHVRANKAASPAFGEGLANALDIGGI